MSLYDLQHEANNLSQAWRSRVLGRVGEANIKVLRMDQRSVIEEVHHYDEGLLVIEGRLQLSVAGERFIVAAGELYVAKAGVPHIVESDSFGTLVIIDLPDA